MNAELIAVGTELLLGDTINTDAAAVARLLSELGINVYWQTVVGDNRARLEQAVQLARTRADLIITTGGTGLSPRDVTPEATRDVLEREIPAIPQAMLYYSLQITPHAMLSRAMAGTRRSSLILNLPGSEKGACENLSAVLGALGHGLKMLAGGGH